MHSGSVRLRNGKTPHEGRVEVLHKHFWGTVCDHYWHDDDASVVCHQLGYGRGVALKKAHFGQGYGKIWLDDVKCRGSEVRLEECFHNGWGTHSCTHEDDAGVKCYNST